MATGSNMKFKHFTTGRCNMPNNQDRLKGTKRLPVNLLQSYIQDEVMHSMQKNYLLQFTHAQADSKNSYHFSDLGLCWLNCLASGLD
jgi:hypothetical protein